MSAKLAENYKLWAKELRNFAKKDVETRDTLLRIAQGYDEAARLMEMLGCSSSKDLRQVTRLSV